MQNLLIRNINLHKVDHQPKNYLMTSSQRVEIAKTVENTDAVISYTISNLKTVTK